MQTGGTLVWRITRQLYAERAFDGEGARLYGGRWNRPGEAVVYTSETLSLAALEYFVQLDPDTAPDDLVAVAAELPPGLAVRSLAPADLPAGWRSYPALEALQELGTAWVRAGETAALSVPSAVIPHERNLLLNPAHPLLTGLRVLPPEPFGFDPRVWK
ncbi:MAG TPA: RES family NAD+ phosphorylase [Thermoanaerobaculia bacterium]